MNEECQDIAPCVWGALVQSAPAEWWLLTGFLITVVFVSWVTVWVLYHRFITRMRSDIDHNRDEQKNDSHTTFDRINQVEETMLQRMDESNKQLREEMQKDSREMREKMDRMIYHLSHIDSQTQDRIFTSNIKQREK